MLRECQPCSQSPRFFLLPNTSKNCHFTTPNSGPKTPKTRRKKTRKTLSSVVFYAPGVPAVLTKALASFCSQTPLRIATLLPQNPTPKHGAKQRAKRLVPWCFMLRECQPCSQSPRFFLLPNTSKNCHFTTPTSGGGPGGTGKPFKRWGASLPTFWKALRGPRGRPSSQKYRLNGRKTYEFIGFGTTHDPQTNEFIGFGTIHGTKTTEFIWFGAIHGSSGMQTPHVLKRPSP